MDTAPFAANKIGLPVKILMFICGIIAMVAGIVQINGGLKEIRDADDSAKIKLLAQEIDAAVEAANKSTLEGQPMFMQLLRDVESLGLTKVRRERREAAQTVLDLFGKSAEQSRLAAKKSAEAAQKETREKYKSYFTIKTQAYEYAAQASAINQDIVRLVLDESIAQLDALFPKALEAGTRRDAAQKNSAEAEAKANAILNDGKDKS